jgi:hypothetical protein
LDPQPPEGVLESTGTDRAGRVAGSSRDEGVAIPGVEGGVKAGETRPGNSSDSGSASSGEESCERPGWMLRELRSSSEMARETGIGRGE